MLSRSCSTATNSLPATNTRWPTPICSRCSTGPISTRSISQNGRTSRPTRLESVQGRRCRKPCGRKVCWHRTRASVRTIGECHAYLTDVLPKKCLTAEEGHAAAAPPRSVMNSRRVFDHLVGDGEQLVRYCQAERFG